MPGRALPSPPPRSLLLPPRWLWLAAVAAALAGGVSDGRTPAALGAESPARAGATLQDLRWITGRWRKTSKHEVLEEHWGEPLGNSMTGTFRWLKQGVGRVYEFLLIEATDDGVTFYLRHLGPGSVAWEPPAEPLDFPLVAVREGEAVFEHPTRRKMKRLIYRRPEPDVLVVRVEGLDAGGETSADEFVFARAPEKKR